MSSDKTLRSQHRESPVCGQAVNSVHFVDLAAEAQRGELTSPSWGRRLEHGRGRGELKVLLLPRRCPLIHAS